jgi:hypothetical protein
MAHDTQHQIEFGGSPVAAEFDGTIAFRLIDRIPVVTISHTFWAHTARQFRYLMGGTVAPDGSLGTEKPFHHQYNWAIIDLRMVSEYRDDTPQFLAEARENFRKLGGDLVAVTYQPERLPAGFKSFESVDEAVVAVKADRAAARRRR